MNYSGVKIRRLLVMVVAVLFAVGINVAAYTPDIAWYTSNTSADTYTIYTADELAGLAQIVNNGTQSFSGKTVRLGNDIVLNDTSASNKGGWRNWDENTEGLNEWTPIGSSTTNNFRGNFDGNGKVISGLYINTTAQNQGLFGDMRGGGSIISDLGLVGFYVRGGSFTGGIIGRSGGIVTNSYAIGNVSGVHGVGGVSGSGGTVTNSYFIGDVKGNDGMAGGIIGATGTVTNSYAIGNVFGVHLVGGIIGGDAENYSDNVTNSWFVGSVTGSNYYIGGICGSCGSVTNSFYNAIFPDEDKSFSWGTPKTTAQMQSNAFQNFLHLYAGLQNANNANNSYMGWTFNADGYPTLSGSKAPAPVINVADYFESGTGAQDDPYVIMNKTQLENINLLNNLDINILDKYFKLGADIVLNDTTAHGGWRTWNQATTGLEQWTPIQVGNFDGNGKVISGLYINSYNCNQGLFAHGDISNLGLVGFYVKGYSVGCIGGRVTNSYAIGNVSGEYNSVGGIASSGLVINSYFVGSVTETGTNYGCGIAGAGTVINSYYNSDLATAINLSTLGTKKTTSEMQSSSFHELLQVNASVLNTVNTDNNCMGWIYNANDYPTLSGSKAPNNINISSYFERGTGAENNPYIVKTKTHLENLAFLANAGKTFEGEYIKLDTNIVLNDTTGWRTWNQATTGLEQWTPIGGGFRGNFDGNGYVISGLYINTTAGNQGLFGNTFGANISNLGLVGFYVRGGNNIGGIIGSGGSISNSYAIGNVVGTSFVGGIIGGSGTVTRSYFVGSVTGTSSIGGIVGSASGSTVTSSFFNAVFTGPTRNSLGTSRTAEQMRTQSTYTGWDFQNIWGISGRINDGYPVYRGQLLIDIAWYTNNPSALTYTISNVNQLEGLAALVNGNAGLAEAVNFSGKTIALGNNIFLNDTTDWRNWDENTNGLNRWIPIASSNVEFNGNFDGKGYVISGLYINSTAQGQGLFGWTSSANISNLGLVGFYVRGGNNVGGISGSGGSISNSYAIGNVSGTSFVGGIIGRNGVVSNSYFVGNVTGTNSVGGIISNNDRAVNSFYNSDLAIADNLNSAGTRTTTAEMQSEGFHDNLQKYASLLNNIENNYMGWIYNAGNYPSLSDSKAVINNLFESGTGAEDDPYIIMNKTQLENINVLGNLGIYISDMYFKLGDNIVLNDTAAHGNWRNWDENTYGLEQWTPIDSAYNFSGCYFDGNGKVISGLYINSTDDRQGLFGAVGFTISNLGLTGFYVKGENYVGGIIGSNSGTVINSYAIGNVSGGGYVGGIKGGWGTVENSYFVGNVTGSDYVSGIIGYSGGKVINSYVIGNVSGGGYVGGILVGGGSVENSYFVGNVTGSDYVGGIVGNSATVRNSYFDGNVEGINNVGGIIGGIGGVENSYFIGNVTGSDYVGGILGNSGAVRNSYFVGNVEGDENVGPMVGNNSTIIHSFYNSDLATAANLNSLGTPKTTAEMQNLAFRDSLQYYAGLLNTVSTDNNYTGWVHNPNNYPTFSGSKAPVVNVASYFDRGTGTESNPYIIMTKTHLENVAFFVNAGKTFDGEYIKLGDNIVLNDTLAQGGWRNWDENTTGLELWESIGGSFSGNFDGNNKVISGLYANCRSSIYQGLFGNAYGANISNLGLVGLYVKGSVYVSGIISYGDNNKITNSYVIGNVSQYEVSSGGPPIGGISSGSYGDIITDSYFIGDVSGNNHTGGIAYYGTVTNSYFVGNVTANYYAGGISVYGSVTNSYIIGNISGSAHVGGISSNGTVTNSYVIGNVTGGNYPVGGISGTGSATNSYFIGNVTGTSSWLGGISGTSSATNSFYNATFTGSTPNSHGTPKNLAEMKTQSTYTGWDFEEIWTIHADINDGYPIIKALSQEDITASAAKTTIENTNFGSVSQAVLNTQPAAKSHIETIISGLGLNGVTPTVVDGAFTAAVAGTVGNVSGNNGSYTFTVKLKKGMSAEYTTAMRTLIITATPYDATQDNADITSAKAAIENTDFGSVPQTIVNSLNFARASVQNIIDELELNGVIPTVHDGQFTPAASGTSGSPAGTNGSYTFTIKLNKGGGTEQETEELALVITATPHDEPIQVVNAQTPTVTAQTSSNTVTEGTAHTISVSASVSDEGALTYQWYISTTDSNTGGTAIEGAIGLSYNVPASEAGTYYYYVVITNTIIDNEDGGIKTVSSASEPILVIVESAPVIPVGFTGLKFITPASDNDSLIAGQSSFYSVQVMVLNSSGNAFTDRAVTIRLSADLSGVVVSKNIVTDASTGIAEFGLIQASAVAGDIITFTASAGDFSETAILHIISPLPQVTVSNVQPAGLTAGPNPVAKSAGTVNFFVGVARDTDDARDVGGVGTLTIFDAQGNVVNKINIHGAGVENFQPALNKSSALDNPSRRSIGSWDLRDTKGRPVAAGTYLVRGTITAPNGKKEKVSIILGVR